MIVREFVERTLFITIDFYLIWDIYFDIDQNDLLLQQMNLEDTLFNTT